MSVAVTPAIRKYAARTNQRIPVVKAEKDTEIKNVGERRWHEAWSTYYPNTPLRHQVAFKIPGHRNPFKMDFLHEASKVVIEVSGGVHSIQSVRKRDYMRTRWLLDNGYLVYTFDPSDLTKTKAEAHCIQVYEAIQRRIV